MYLQGCWMVEYHPDLSINHPFIARQHLHRPNGEVCERTDDEEHTINHAPDESNNKDVRINGKLYQAKPTMIFKSSSGNNSHGDMNGSPRVSKKKNMTDNRTNEMIKGIYNTDNDVHNNDNTNDFFDIERVFESPFPSMKRINKSSNLCTNSSRRDKKILMNDCTFNVNNNFDDYKFDHDTDDDQTIANASSSSRDDDVVVYHLFQFPTLEELSTASEADLRAIGMGYRARFIIESLKIIQQQNMIYNSSVREGCDSNGNRSIARMDNNEGMNVNIEFSTHRNKSAGQNDNYVKNNNNHYWFHHLRSYSTLYNNNKENIEKNIISDNLHFQFESGNKKRFKKTMENVDDVKTITTGKTTIDCNRDDIVNINHDIMSASTRKRSRKRAYDVENVEIHNNVNTRIKTESFLSDSVMNSTTTFTKTNISNISTVTNISNVTARLDALSRNHIQDILLQLPGVGRKVADCISLFSLDQCSIIPIDTHVWSIVSRDYDPTLKDHKSLTPTLYHKVRIIMS